MKFIAVLASLIGFSLPQLSQAQAPEMQWAAIRAKDKYVRTQLVTQGFSIENVVEDMSYGVATDEILDSLKLQGFEVVSHFPMSEFRQQDFPAKDGIYHNYAEMKADLDKLVRDFPGLVFPVSMGKTLEGRDMIGVRINPTARDGNSPSGLPGVIFMGGHHAREHLSIEVPLKLARYLAEGSQTNDVIHDLLSRRDIYIFPSINPDGSEFDISTGSYKSWRKNRRTGQGRCDGVDLNRNYGYGWGTGGSSTDPCSDVFMGPKPFSEPETQNVKAFVESKPNLKVLLSFHTFSELVLYPWGGKNDPISNQRDLSAFTNMARTMASWNGYTPEQSSDLYIASGDTTDWAYGTLGIFAFTFELSPKDMWSGGGFYPGPDAVERTFQANIKPALYLIDLADDPYRAAFRPETTLFFGQR